MNTAVRHEVLHYLGYDRDEGGIVTLLHSLRSAAQFEVRIGLNRGAIQGREPALSALEFAPVEGETISLANAWRCRTVAREVRGWLAADRRRIFHGHSRAGLLVALWLTHWGERRVVATVHCYGRQRWFYRWSAARLGRRLFFLSPTMRRYYGLPVGGWSQCMPEATPATDLILSSPLPGRLRLGGIGSLVAWKQWGTIVEALALLPESLRAHVSFVHIGPGRVDELRRQAERSGVAAQVEFRGPEPSSRRLLSEIDALVVASRNEPFSLAMLEALAAGVPVLAADSGGALDVIVPEKNGRFFHTGDPRSLAERIANWLRAPPDWDRAVLQASAPDIAATARQWRSVYSELERS